MKSVRSFLIGIIIIGSMAAGPNLLHAQTAMVGSFNNGLVAVQSATPDSIVQILADENGLDLVSPGQAPRSGTFWTVTASGAIAPYPCPPQDLTVPVYHLGEQWLVDETAGEIPVSPRRFGMQAQTTGGMAVSGLETEAATVLNLIERVQTTTAGQSMRTMAGGVMMAADGMSPPGGGGGFGTNGFYSDSFNYTVPTNGLFLTLTNVSNGFAWLNLHNATNLVYEVLSKTDLSAPSWNIEQEVWPTDTNSMPFIVSESGRTNLFIWAQDWTGVTENGNTTPDWWFWEYFGTTALSDTNLDSQGNTLLSDYQNGVDPNLIQFTIEMVNNYVNTTSASLQLDITAGTPSYYAVLVNDTNPADANWQPCTNSNLIVFLGTTDGAYNVSIGLRGLPANATQTWQGQNIIKDTAPAELVITNLASFTGSRPFIDPAGYSTKALSGLTFAVTNANGTVAYDQGSVVDQDCNPADMNHTTNRFVCLDVALTLGTNHIGVNAVDWAGNVTTTNFSYIFDTNGDTTPPVIALTWPQDGMEVSGSSFTLRGTLDDDTATVSGQWTDTNGVTQTVSGLVERGGRFWLQNLSLNPGTNIITVTATDAAGNPASTNLTLVQSGVTLTMDPMDVNQLNQVYVDVSGEISDPTYDVWVNGVEVTNDYDTDGFTWYWLVDNVPVTAGGTANFDMTAYPPGYAPTGNSWTNFAVEEDSYPNPQPADPVQAHADWDKQPAVYVKTWQFDTTGFNSDDESWGQGGGGHLNVNGNYLNNWPGDAGDVPEIDGTGSYSAGKVTYYTNRDIGLPPFQWIDFAASSGVAWDPPTVQVNWTATGAQVVELFTGGKPMRLAKSLFILSQALSRLQFSEWDDYGIYAPGDNVIPPGNISLGSYGNLNSDGTLAMLAAEGQHLVITPKTSQPWYSGNLPGKAKYTLKHQTFYPALTDANLSRLNLGVGENVGLSGMPNKTVWAGPGLLLTNSAAIFVAPSNAAPSGTKVSVTATVPNSPVLTVNFTVFPPTGFDHAQITGTNSYPIGTAGAGMTTAVWIAPTSVSFYRVWMEEVGKVSTNATGYFANTNVWPAANLDHGKRGANNWFQLTSQNQWYDGASSGTCVQPWSAGNFTWPIPAAWQVGSPNSSTTNYIAGWNQNFMIDASGTVIVQKFGISISRTINNIITKTP